MIQKCFTEEVVHQHVEMGGQIFEMFKMHYRTCPRCQNMYEKLLYQFINDIINRKYNN